MIVTPWFELFEPACKAIGMGYDGMKICELGNQWMQVEGIKCGVGKEYFTSLGAEHVSIDLNGRAGALRLDLSKDILLEKPEWKGYFDLVSDIGTLEHVQDGVYEGFKNVHNFCRKGGVMIHSVPLSGHWYKHSPYHFQADFFKKLAAVAKYVCVLDELRTTTYGRHSRKPKTNTNAILVKENDVPFISKEEFVSLGGIDEIGRASCRERV